MALLDSSSETKFLLNNPKEVSLPFRVEKPMFMPWSFKIFRYFKVVVAMFAKMEIQTPRNPCIHWQRHVLLCKFSCTQNGCVKIPAFLSI